MFKGKATGGARSAERAEVLKAIKAIGEPGGTMALRVLPGGRSFVGKVDDPVEMLWFVEKQDDYSGIYYTLNPVRHDLDGNAKKADILHRRWLLVDIDPVRPADLSATDDEHERARWLATQITGDLMSLGWPLPLTIDSGNGWHLLYRIDLPNDELSRALVKGVLAGIADRFDTDKVKVDRAVHDAPRIAKLPGTWARKGPNVKDRPHRLCKIVGDVGGKIVVTMEQLQKLAPKAEPKKESPPSPAPPPPAPETAIPFRGRAKGEAWTAYASAALESELDRLKRAATGERNNVLNVAAFCLGQFVPGGHLHRADLEAALMNGALAAGLTEAESRATIKSGLDAGAKFPRAMPEPSRNGTHPAPAGPKFAPDESIIYRASVVTPKRVEWLWQGRIPRGKLTTFAGVGGLGKTFVLCDIAARVSKGLPWPDAAPMAQDCIGQVIFISGEDDPDDTLVPRLIELGADLERIVFLKTKVQDEFTLADLETLDEAIKQAGPNVQLVIIDPPTAYLGGVDDHNNAELRSLLSPLKSWTARHRVGMIFNTHVNKGGAGKTEAMMRVMGSVAWVNAVRAAYMFARDPEDQDRVLFIPMKMNIARRRKGMAYRIKPLTEEPDGPATVEWLGEVDTTADEAVKGDGSKSRKAVATEWLVEKFRQKLEWRSEDLFRAGRQDNISRDAIFEAKRVLDLPRAKRVVHHNGDIEYLWWINADSPLLSQGEPAPCDSYDSCDSKDGIQW